MLLLVLRHQGSAIHRFGGYYYVQIYHRPYHDHNSVTCVHPNAYALFVASQTSGYNWDFVVHMVFLKKKSCGLQARNELYEYTYDNHFNKLKSNYYNINIFPFDLYFKRIYV